MSEAPRAVFLSYASQDAQAAARICEALRAAGLEVWFDRSELRGGDAWDASIRRQVRDCALFVPVVSANTDSRSEGYFRLEWKLAVDRSHLMADDQPFLVPVVIDATPEASARVPDRFRERQWSRLSGDDSMRGFAERVSLLLRGEAPTAPAAIARTLPPAAAGDDTPSIAVLPFANRSGDSEDEYFSDGLADELLNVLAKIRGLRVAARTSSFQFKGRSEDVGAIGRKLKVSTLLEGSVRKSGNRVRISVQLVKASDGYQLWSQTFDRTLEDIFAVQDDIARTVVAELRETLLGEAASAAAIDRVSREVAQAARGRSENAEAHRLFLQGRYFVERLSGADIQRGIECLKAALALDPDFALAHALLSRAHTYEGGYGLRLPTEVAGPARAAASRSLALEPDLVEGHLALGTLQMFLDWDWAGARASHGRALELAPDKPEAHRDYGLLLYLLGRFDEAHAHGLRSVELDPLNATNYLYLASSQLALGRLKEAEATCRTALEISPDGFGLRYWLAMTLDAQERQKEALAEARLDRTIWSRLTCLACLHFRDGNDAESSAALAELKQSCSADAAFQIAQVHAVREEPDEAFAWLERAFDQRDAGVSLARSAPWFDAIHGDPRWGAFLRKVGLGD